MSTETEKQVQNGVNVDALLGARDALSKAPEAAKFNWKASCKWMNGTHSQTSIQGFYGLGQQQSHKNEFTFDSDVRNGFNDIKVNFEIDADASKDDLEALVAQSQKRSAVYDVITNPTNVSVSVAKTSVN